MLLPEGLCLDLKNQILFRPKSSESRRRLPNRHGNEEEAIDRTDFIAPAVDRPQKLDPSFPKGTQIGVGHDSESQSIIPSLLIPPSIILPSQQTSRPGRKEASPVSSVSQIGTTVRSKHNSHLRSMPGAETLGNPRARSFPSHPLVNSATQSSLFIPMAHESTSGSPVKSTRTEVTIALRSHKAEPPADETRCGGIIFASSSTPSNLNTDTSTSSPPLISAVPSTKQPTYPSVKPQLTIPIPAGVIAKANTTGFDDTLLVPPFKQMAIVPNVPRAFNVKRKPPPPLSNLAKPSPTSIIAGQASSSTRGGSSLLQGIASSYKGVSDPPLPSSSMYRKVGPFLRDGSYPLSSTSKPRSASTSSGSSYLTTAGPTPQSSFPDLPSPPPTRPHRLSMKRLLPKPASLSSPSSRSLVKCSSKVPEACSVDPKARLSAPGDKSEFVRTLGDQIRSSDHPGNRINSVYPRPSSSSILSVINQVLRSKDTPHAKEHDFSTFVDDVQSSKAQPAVLVSTGSTNMRDRSSVCEKGEPSGGGMGLSSPFRRNRKDSKMDKPKGEETDNEPARRQRNVLRKRSHPSVVGLSRSTSTLASSRSPSHHDGYTLGAGRTREPVHRDRRLHDVDRISINQPQSVAALDRSELRILQSGTGFNGSPAASQPLGMKDVGLQLTSHQDFALAQPRRRHREDVSDAERLTPAALIAMECKAKMAESSGNLDECYVVSDPQPRGKPEDPTDGMSIKDRSLLRSASMSEILFFNAGSTYEHAQDPETICYEWDKRSGRARQSLNLSITIHPNQLDEEKLRKSPDVVSSKAGGGKLRKLMRKFSLSRKRGEHTPMASVVTGLSGDQNPSHFKAETRSRISVGHSRSSISNPETSAAFQALPKSSPAHEIPPLPKHPTSIPIDLHIVDPSVLDQTYHEAPDWTQPGALQNLSVLPTSSSPKVPPEGEWIRSNSPDLELAALPLPPRRASRVSTEADDTNVTHSRPPCVPVLGNATNTFLQTTLATSPTLGLRQSRPVATTPSSATNSADLLTEVPNLKSCGSIIPSISVSPPLHLPLTNDQRANRKRLIIGDAHPRKLDPLLRMNTNYIPPLHRMDSFQEYSSERNTSSNCTMAQPMSSVLRSTVEDPLVPAEDTDPNLNSYLAFTRPSLRATSVFRPGTANTFGGSEILGSNTRPGTSDSVRSAISTSTVMERELYGS